MTEEAKTLLNEAIDSAFEKGFSRDLEINGNAFSISVYTDEVCAWCDRGATALYTKEHYRKDTDKEIVREELIERISKFVDHNVIHCCDCGVEMNRDDAGGRYFAGLYCQKCWDTKWKKIEQNERYD